MIDLSDLKVTHCDDGLDYDDYIAHLEFEENSMSMDQSAFTSMMAEPGLISTDSLDMAAIRARCEASKDDYKLTFEDSGQWNSGIFCTTNQRGQQTGQKYLVNINEEDESLNHNISLKLLNQLNERWVSNNSTPSQLRDDVGKKRQEVTTWKSIKGEDLLDGRTTTASSLPELRRTNNINIQTNSNQSPAISDQSSSGGTSIATSNFVIANSTKRHPKLLANFVKKQKYIEREAPMQFVDDGYNNPQFNRHYVDINQNEIDYIPDNIEHQDNKPSSSFDNPELKFISLSHKVPSICRPSVSLNNILKTKRDRGGSIDEIVESCMDEQIVIDEPEPSDESVKFGSCNITSDPDSGLGTSNNFEGPVHIDDWSSLALLLPKNVVEACSFFKSNSSLLTGSADNNIDRKVFKPVGRNISSLRCITKQKYPTCFNCPEITTSEILTRELAPYSKLDQESSLNIQELSLIGLPFYDQKRTLVDRVIEGVAELSRGSPMPILLEGLESLISDGLRSEFQTWDLIKQMAIPGPITDGIYKKVQEIENIEDSSHKTKSFLRYLIKVKSIDGWFTYIIQKKNVIDRFYTEDAFLRKANNLYRSLFRRLIEVLELLCIINRNKFTKHNIAPGLTTKSATSLPSDSRIPKSSSMPISGTIVNHKEEESRRICGINSRRRYQSRIPILYSRRNSLQRTFNSISGGSSVIHHLKQTEFRIGKAKDEVNCAEFLPLQKNEAVRILGMRDGFVRCCRLHFRNGVIINGKVPAELLDLRQ